MTTVLVLKNTYAKRPKLLTTHVDFTAILLTDNSNSTRKNETIIIIMHARNFYRYLLVHLISIATKEDVLLIYIYSG